MKSFPFASIFVNLLGTLVLAAIVSIGCSADNSESQDEQSVQQSNQDIPQSAERDKMESYLPEANDSRWSMVDETRYFVADNLWEYINGGAEGYIVFDFKSVLAADISNKKSGQENTLDIYNMSTPKNSFGIYSAERSYDAEYIDVGVEGYLSGNTLNFYLGPYYVKLTAFEESEQARNDLQALAKSVEAKMEIKREPPKELTVFPNAGIVDHSIRYHSANVLGQSDLKNGFTADYKVGDNEFKLFFILHENIRQANESFESYMAYMQKYGKNQEIYNHGETPWFAADDPYYGKVITEQSGRVVLGILEAPDPETASEYLQNMRLNLVSLGLI